MKKIALTLGAAIVAISALQVSAAEAGGKKFHFGFHKPHWNAHFYGKPYHFYGPKFCFWKKRKIFTPGGWYWKKVRICKPYWRY